MGEAKRRGSYQYRKKLAEILKRNSKSYRRVIVLIKKIIFR